jgi:hypothetical protein
MKTLLVKNLILFAFLTAALGRATERPDGRQMLQANKADANALLGDGGIHFALVNLVLALMLLRVQHVAIRVLQMLDLTSARTQQATSKKKKEKKRK